LGIRSLSSVLKVRGHGVRLIFLPSTDTQRLRFRADFADAHKKDVLEQVISLCEGSDIVGISLMSNYYQQAVQLTRAVKLKYSMPIIWGGVHPTLEPVECAQMADIVCIGEGETALVELVEKMERGQDYYDTRNFWFSSDGRIIRNNVRPLIQDLDSLPFLDYALDDDYILDEGTVKKMDATLLKRHLPKPDDIDNNKQVSYKTMVTRGCPHNCSFCANYAFRKMYPKQKYLRRRSVENVMSELVQMRERLPEVRIITFADDSFVAAPLREIEEFCTQYKERIDLPFRCLCSPTTISREKMEPLVEAGLLEMQMGIQTGSERTRQLYNRRIATPKVLEAAEIIHQSVRRTRPPKYDVIIDNPYETEDDLLETLDLLLKIPRPYDLTLFSLVFYPGTELLKMAKRDHLVHDVIKDVYQKSFLISEKSFIHLLFHMAEANLPIWLIRLLMKKNVLYIFNRKKLNPVYTALYKMGRIARICSKRLRSLCLSVVKR
jgi:radical SAM superfamily enzyme YgiQ (UPF0313 family)